MVANLPIKKNTEAKAAVSDKKEENVKAPTFNEKELHVSDSLVPKDLYESYAFRVEAIMGNLIGLSIAETGVNFGDQVTFVTLAFLEKLEGDGYRLSRL